MKLWNCSPSHFLPSTSYEIKSGGVVIEEIEDLYEDGESFLRGGHPKKYTKISQNTGFRTSRPKVFYEKDVIRNFTKFTGKHLCQSLFYNKVPDLRPATSLKKRFWHRCFPVNFVKFLRTPFLAEHLWWLLLRIEVLLVISNRNSNFSLDSNLIESFHAQS